jgi:hypothetical protein
MTGYTEQECWGMKFWIDTPGLQELVRERGLEGSGEQ